MYLKIFACFLGFYFGVVNHGFCQLSKDDTTMFPQNITTIWHVKTNFLDGGKRYQAVLKLNNKSKKVLGSSEWSLYFNYLGTVDPKSLPPAIELTHINGNFYKLKPTAQFESLHPGEQFAIPFEAPGSKIKESDAPSGLYFVFNEDGIIPISEPGVTSFSEDQQLHRSPSDKIPVPTAEVRYKQNEKLRALPADSIGYVIPTPQLATQQQGTFELNGSVTIGYEKELKNEAQVLSASLAELLGEEIKVREDSLAESDILLTLDSSDDNKSESYELRINPRQVKISGEGAAGVFYGIQSLRSLISPEAYQKQSSIKINAQQIKDAPRFGYRGLHLDVARNFQSASAVKKLLDVMAFYKLNTFHFHLTDDEGWRLPVKELPELTEVGGQRGHTESESEHMIPSYGSGPDPDKAPGSGWYDRETFIDILQYAHERHIQVIPEIDVPGHARAAIVAMKSRYEKYKSEGNIEAANRYRLHEPEDQSQYRSVQNWDDNVINVCQNSTYRFMETVVNEIVEMYDEAGVPLATIHMGGDEVPNGAWEKSPACQDLIQQTEELDSVDDLPDYFFGRIHSMLAERNLSMAGWEEIALDDGDGGSAPDSNFAGTIRPNVWANIWGSGLGDRAYQLANAGYEVVMSQASNFYFDLSYNKHPKEPGLYWAGFLGSRAPYAFMPFDLYKNAEEDILGNPISEDAYSDAVRLSDEGRKNILGLQGQLWGEKLVSQDRMEYMAMPRLFGLAERAWAQQPDWASIEKRKERNSRMNEDWNEFANRLGQRELPRMDYFHSGMHYRLSPPGAIIEDNILKANVAYPGLTIRYTLDGSEPSEDSNKYTNPVALEGEPVVKLRTFSSDGRGSRTVTIGGEEEISIID